MQAKKDLKALGFTEEAMAAPATKQSVDEARRKVDKLMLSALADPKVREELKKNPASVFVKAGLPAGAVEDLERNLVIDNAALARDCTVTCLYTCWWTDW